MPDDRPRQYFLSAKRRRPPVDRLAQLLFAIAVAIVIAVLLLLILAS